MIVFYSLSRATQKQRLWIQSCLVRQGGVRGKEGGNDEEMRGHHEICLLRRDLPVMLPVRSSADLRPLIVCTISSVMRCVRS
jgi:hypothetical protein